MLDDYKIKWPTAKEQHAYLRMRQYQNMRKAISNKNENWMHNKLMKTGLKWSRQAIWGYRLFDFWCHEKGIAVEVDGPEHDAEKDAARDMAYYRKSGILVWRVPNGDEEAAAYALGGIAKAEAWSVRRKKLGLPAIKS